MVAALLFVVWCSSGGSLCSIWEVPCCSESVNELIYELSGAWREEEWVMCWACLTERQFQLVMLSSLDMVWIVALGSFVHWGAAEMRLVRKGLK